jgi:polysaccharide biosynthesis protein PslG
MSSRLLTAFVVVVLTTGGCARAPLPDTPDSAAPSRTLTFSILEDYDKGDDLADVARDFALFRELNVTTWRGSFGWDDYEPKQGQYDFAWLHGFIELAEQRGISLRPYIGYTPEWAAGGKDTDGQAWNQPPRDQRAWSGFVRAMRNEVRHHPNVRSLEIYNEQNVTQWWEGTVDDYRATLRSAAGVTRGLELLMGGLVFPDVEWIETLCDGTDVGTAFSVLPIHAYPETWTSEGVTVENYLGAEFRTSFLRAADRSCGRKRIWINETGFATTPGKSEIDQAAWWARAMATFAAEPRIEHIGIYEIKDLAPDRPAIGDAPNYHLGLTTVDRTKKLAFSTVKLMVALLGDQPFSAGTLNLGPRAVTGELHHHAFTREDGSTVIVIWNRTADEVVKFTLPRAGRVLEYGLDGAFTEHSLKYASFEIRLKKGLPRVFELR